MMDWLYRSLVLPGLLRLTPEKARSDFLSWIARVASVPGGLRLLGLAPPRPDFPLSCGRAVFPTWVGLGAEVDPFGRVMPLWDRSCAGFVEVGPVSVEPMPAAVPSSFWPAQFGWWTPDPTETQGLSDGIVRLSRFGPLRIPVAVRLGIPPQASAEDMTRQLADTAARICEADAVRVFVLDTLKLAIANSWPGSTWSAHVSAIAEAVHHSGRLLWVTFPADVDGGELQCWKTACLLPEIDGIKVEGILRHDGGVLHGTPGRKLALNVVRTLREMTSDKTLVASGGILSPEDALSLVEAGANLLCIDTGLLFTGPGLIRRICRALRDREALRPPGARDVSPLSVEGQNSP